MWVNTRVTSGRVKVHINYSLALVVLSTTKCVAHSQPIAFTPKLYKTQRSNNKQIQNVISECEIKGKVRTKCTMMIYSMEAIV